jgi:DNA-binding CsgD family transcriptional regulator
MDEDIAIVIEHLKMIEKLLGNSLVKDLETAKDRIIRLAKFGLSPSEISEILGETSNYVNVTLSNARKDGIM